MAGEIVPDEVDDRQVRLTRYRRESNKPLQQRTLIFAALQLLLEASTAGVIAEPGYRWRRENYTEPNWASLKQRR